VISSIFQWVTGIDLLIQLITECALILLSS